MSLLKRRYMMSLGESERLPSGYQEIEYIEKKFDGTNTAYIDTGINASYDLVVEANLKCELGVDSHACAVFASRVAFTNKDYTCLFQNVISNGQKYDSRFGNFAYNYGSYLVEYPSGFHTLTWGNGYVFINHIEKLAMSNSSTFTSSLNVYLFAGNSNGSVGFYEGDGRLQIKEFKMRRNGVLLRHFIPCYRKSDSEVGMYDLVSGTFFTNQGSGEFIMGGATLNAKQKEIYQKVEYIQSSGGQYIDTGYVPTQNTQMELDFADNDTTNDTILCGCRNDTLTDTRYSMGTNEDTFLFSYGYAINKVDRPTISNGVRHYAQMKYASAIFDGANYNIHIEEITFTRPIYIGCGNWGGSALWFAKCKYYGFRLKEGNVYVRNLVPVYRKSDNEIGMLDVVNNVFYTNEGSGAFVVGANV